MGGHNVGYGHTIGSIADIHRAAAVINRHVGYGDISRFIIIRGGILTFERLTPKGVAQHKVIECAVADMRTGIDTMVRRTV